MKWYAALRSVKRPHGVRVVPPSPLLSIGWIAVSILAILWVIPGVIPRDKIIRVTLGAVCVVLAIALLVLEGLAQQKMKRLCDRARECGYAVCPECGYLLVGLPDSGTCPECGVDYSPAELRLQWQRAERRFGGFWCFRRRG